MATASKLLPCRPKFLPFSNLIVKVFQSTAKQVFLFVEHLKTGSTFDIPLKPLNDPLEEGVEGAAVQRPYSLVDFELIRVIGRGSYAKVLMVELRRTRRVYAMKVIKKELVTDDEVTRTRKHQITEISEFLYLTSGPDVSHKLRTLIGCKRRSTCSKRRPTIRF